MRKKPRIRFMITICIIFTLLGNTYFPVFAETKSLRANSSRSYEEITGTLPDSITGLDKLYYGSVKNDSTAPFHNAEELQNILENGDPDYAKLIWKQYKYDLYDPNYQNRGGCKALMIAGRPDYADELLESTSHEYPKDGNSPFHEETLPEIDSVDNGELVNGALVENDENAFEQMKKTVSPDKGDQNQNRKYNIDLKATANLKQVKPVVFLFQIQTSWQMFDKMHANDRASLVNGQKVTEELLSLYEMKQGFLEFMNWMKQCTDGSLMIGITNFQHGGSYSMIDPPYFTNHTESIKEGLYGWDSFGDCEHIHYTNNELKKAQTQLNMSKNFQNWVDANGQSIYNNADMISIIVGGACEKNDLKTGSVKLPEIPNGVIKQQYGIRTNSGTGVIADDKISWIDYCAEGTKKEGGAFDTGKYYKDVITRSKFVETLKDIYATAQEKASNNQKVKNVKVEDTVTAEFNVDQSEIKAFLDGEDVTDQSKIKVMKNADGTTKVSYTFEQVSHKQEVHLQIPIQAKDDFIGSNNVYTNQGTPSISYTGRINNEETYTQNFEDTPAVNVPIRFKVSDGQSVSVEPEKSVNLADLSRDSSGNTQMTKQIEDLLDKYDQTEGTLIYQWVDEEGNPVGDPTSKIIKDNDRTPPEIPSYVVNTTKSDIGKEYKYQLKVTFQPAEVKESTTSKIAVNERTETGKVGIYVEQKPEGKVYIKKEVDNYQSELSNDSFIIQVTSKGNIESPINTEVVLKHNDKSAAIMIKEKTILDISEIVPKEYETVDISISGDGEKVSDHEIAVDRGQNVTITVHNKYSAKAFFQTSDMITNTFK